MSKFYDENLDDEELKKEYLKLNSHCKYKTSEELAKMCDSYFAKCNSKGKPYTISGLAFHLGLTTQTLRNYSKLYGDTEYADIINYAKQKIEEYAETALYDSRTSTGGKYVLNNCFEGWADKSNVDVSGEVTFKKLEDIINESDS